MNILIVEDDDILRHHLSYQLESMGHRVHVASDARDGLYLSSEYPLDVAIVDLGLPGMDGISMIREARSQGRTFPILILTARGNWQDKVDGLEAGADDYVVKPFQFEELQARLQALVRRSSGFSQPKVQAGPFSLDLSRKQLTVNDQTVNLTAYEYEILEFMVRNSQQVISRSRLVEHLYSDDGRDSNVVEVLVGRLRRKLELAGGVMPIETIRGQGYVFNISCQ